MRDVVFVFAFVPVVVCVIFKFRCKFDYATYLKPDKHAACEDVTLLNL